MRPDAYMPVYFDRLLTATDGYSDRVFRAYNRVLWHYWSHTHCQGLPNSDEYLRGVSRIDMADWAATKPILFGVFFKQDDTGLWQQNECRRIYEQVNDAYRSRVESVAKARQAKLDTSVDTNVDTKGDPKPKPNIKPDPKPEPCDTHKGRPAPTLEQVKTRAAMTGMLEADAIEFWNHYDAIGWVTGSGQTVVRWESKMDTWKTEARAKQFQEQRKAPAERPKSVLDLKTIMEAKSVRAAELKNQFCREGPLGDVWSDTLKRGEYFALTKAIRKLREQIGGMA